MKIDDDTIARIVDFHGHMCPGLAMGVQASRIALERIGPHASDEEVVAIVETDMCAVDAVQFLTGCTFGKGNLRHADWGKNAFTFFRRSDGKALRVSVRPDTAVRDPEHQELFALVAAGTATDDQRGRFRDLHASRSKGILDGEPEDFYLVEEFLGIAPAKARIHSSITCAECGEGAMETRIRRMGGRELCQPCFEAAEAGRPNPRRGRRDLTLVGSNGPDA